MIDDPDNIGGAAPSPQRQITGCVLHVCRTARQPRNCDASTIRRMLTETHVATNGTLQGLGPAHATDKPMEQRT
jgi:hypothetical protein